MEMDRETMRMLWDIEYKVMEERCEQISADVQFIKMVFENMTIEQKRRFALKLKEELENDSE